MTSGWLIGLAAPPVIALCFGRWRRRGWARPAQTVLTLILVLLAIVAPSIGSAIFRGSRNVEVRLIDLSDSMGRDVERLLTAEVLDPPPAGRFLVIGFAESAVLLQDGETRDRIEAPAILAEPGFRRRARLDRALALLAARLEVGEVAHIVVLSDGGIDLGAATRAARGLANLSAATVEFHPAPATRVEDLGLRVVSAPAALRPGEAPLVEVEVFGNLGAERELKVLAEGGAAETLVLPAGPVRRRLLVQGPIPSASGLRLRLDGISDFDVDPRNGVVQLELPVEGDGPEVLIVGGRPEAGAAWMRRLAGRPIRPRVLPPDRAGAALAAADLVVVEDLDLDEPAARAFAGSLTAYVASGGGLLLAGADQAFGLGHWADGAIDLLSPLGSRPERQPRLVTVILDRSGSMEGDRFRRAAAAVRSLMRELEGEDRLRLLLAGAGLDARDFRPGESEALEAHLAAVRPAGGTRIAPALDRALGEACPEGARSLVILLTDGDDPVSFTMDQARGWRQAAAAGRHALQVFWFDRRDEGRAAVLAELTGAPGASLVRLDDLAGLPELFVAEVSRDLVLLDRPVLGAGEDRRIGRMLRTRIATGAEVLAAVDSQSAAVGRVRRGTGRVGAWPFRVDDADLRAAFGSTEAALDFALDLAGRGRRADAVLFLRLDADGGEHYRLEGLRTEALELELRLATGIRRLGRCGPEAWESSTLEAPAREGLAAVGIPGGSDPLARLRAPASDPADRDLRSGIPAEARRLLEAALAPGDAPAGGAPILAALALLLLLLDLLFRGLDR